MKTHYLSLINREIAQLEWEMPAKEPFVCRECYKTSPHSVWIKPCPHAEELYRQGVQHAISFLNGVARNKTRAAQKAHKKALYMESSILHAQSDEIKILALSLQTRTAIDEDKQS